MSNQLNMAKIFRQMIRENRGMVDLTKVDRSNLATNASNVLDLLIGIGCRGKYDPDEARGIAYYRGYEIEFSTGSENFYFKLGDKRIAGQLFTKSPRNIIPMIKKFLDAVSNYE